jgi:arylsulfatase A
VNARVGRRAFLAAISGAISTTALRGDQKSPNIIIILADDLGYGDIGCYGSSIPTPNLDNMAAEGVRFMRHYSASPVCSPSRASLLTGRYPVRTGVTNVLMADSKSGLAPTERTIARVLNESGYRTACVGKWHLGFQPDHRPEQHGFDEFFGVPYSNDMNPLPLLMNSQVVDNSPPQTSLTEHFTARSIEFIERNKTGPFFLYLAHTAPHIPLAPSARLRGSSGHGAYGDLVAELDWSTGQILEALKRNAIDDNTLVIFTSDNGPWYQGSPGNLRGRKGSTYEGGVRVPCIARFPGKIPAGNVSQALTSTMDFLPTIARFTGASITPDAVDGIDISSVLTGEKAATGRDPILFFDGTQIQCVRWGPWKLHLSRYNSFPWTVDPPGGRVNLPLLNPELYHVDHDPGENYDRAPENPEIVRDLKARVERLLLSMPDNVRTDWRETLSRRVGETPVGALPRLD